MTTADTNDNDTTATGREHSVSPHRNSQNYGTLSTTTQDAKITQPEETFPDNDESPRSKLQEVIDEYRGVFLLLIAEFLSSSMGLITKYLETSLPSGRRLHPFHVMWCRMIGTLVCSFALGWWQKTEYLPFGRRDIRWILVLRSVGGFVGLSGFYFGLTALPLPDSTVITFLAPIIVGITCSLLPALREPFTLPERLSASVAFIGVILIARPSFLYSFLPFLDDHTHSDPSNPVTPAARALAVSVAVLGVFGAATAYTSIRWIGARADPLIPIIYFSAIVTVGTTFAMLLIPGVPPLLIPLDRQELLLLLAISLCGFVMQWTLTRGLQLEKAGRATQMLYVQLVFAVVFEWLVWGDVPRGLSLIGGGLVMASVVFVNTYKTKKKELMMAKAKRPDVEEQRALLGGTGNDE